MPCSHCKQKGHNKRTCPILNQESIQQELIQQELIQKQKLASESLFIQQQNLEYELAEKADIERQKQEKIQKQLAEPTPGHLRELRLKHFMKC